MESQRLADLRRDYSSKQLTEATIEADPFSQFSCWLDEALDSEVLDAAAMSVSTVSPHGRPSSRIVLLKGFTSTGFVFYTNYESKKASDLEGNPSISLHFFWPPLERQVIITGTAQKTTRKESEDYFASRPLESRIAAWASKQSSAISDRQQLEKQVQEVRERFSDGDVPCPPFWGGFRVSPVAVEFWQGRANRLHDRICYRRNGDSWQIVRLSP